jgi:hypothetical protein
MTTRRRTTTPEKSGHDNMVKLASKDQKDAHNSSSNGSNKTMVDESLVEKAGANGRYVVFREFFLPFVVFAVVRRLCCPSFVALLFCLGDRSFAFPREDDAPMLLLLSSY